MGSKQAAKKGREEQGKANWKRKREGNSGSKDGSSQTQPSKKRRQAAREPSQDGSADISVPLDTTPSIAPTSKSASGDLNTTHDVTSINIISSTHIQKKVTQTLALLSEYPPIAKPKVVLLHAKAPIASKLITIAEIAKREIAKSGGKWFQYNKVEEVMVERKETLKKGGEKLEEEKAPESEEDDETTTFETMKTPFERVIEGKPKVRGLPVMTLYLSRVRIASLRKAYGEQTNALMDSK